MLMTIALDSEQGPNGSKLSEILREEVREMMTQEPSHRAGAWWWRRVNRCQMAFNNGTARALKL